MTVSQTGKWTGMSSQQTEQPIPLLRPLPKAQDVPLADLGPIADVVEAIAFITQAPAGLALQAVLGATSTAAQGHADVKTLHASSPISLFLLTIAKSGERKSACDKLATKAIREYQGPRLRQFAKEFARYEEAKAAKYSNQFEVIEDPASTGVGVFAAPPANPKILFENLTLEGLVKHFETGQPSVAIFTDEGGTFFGGHSMKDTNRINTSTNLSRLWDGKDIDRTRSGSAIVTLPGRRSAAHIAVQPKIGLEFLGDEAVLDQGLTCRFLIAFPESTCGNRLIDRSEEACKKRRKAKADLELYGKRLTALLERPLPLVDDESQELEPRLLKLSDDARAQLEAFYNATEAQIGDGGIYENISGTVSKAAEQVARISGVLTLYDDPDATMVSGAIMSSALALMHFYLEEALRLLDTGKVPKRIEDAENLRVWLCDHWDEDLIDASTVARRGPNSLRTAQKAKDLFRVLSDHGWLVREDGRQHVDGRVTRQAWRIIRDG